MKQESRFKVWFRQIRGPFLVLPIALVLIGVAAAYRQGIRHCGHALLLLLGVILTHVSVNLFNEISDYKTRIDESTTPTPFSGGSGMLQAGKTSVFSVTVAAYTTMVIAAVIGFYFCLISGWLILIFMAFGAVAIRFYTSHLARWLVGELFCGLALGTFVVLGVYYALTGRLTIEIILISIPPGILTLLLLFLNEFPDAEADERGGRHHLIIHFGKRRGAVIYAVILALLYIVILLVPFVSDAPYTTLIALLTMPLALKASSITLKHYDDTAKLVPALGLNVGIVIFTDLLLALAYFL
jgi:1,4-dihydroxy-2-naphthoate octaprenyltransferase